MYERFEELCREKGISSYRVSKETGVAQSSLSNWKNGISTPGALSIAKIAAYFDVSAAWLMGETNSRNSSELFKTISPQRQFLMDKLAKATDEDIDKLAKIWEIVDSEQD